MHVHARRARAARCAPSPSPPPTPSRAARRQFGRPLPAAPRRPAGAGHVIRTGEKLVVQRRPAGPARVDRRDEEHLRLLASLGLRVGHDVPLKAGDRTIGALIARLSRSGPHATPTTTSRWPSRSPARAALAVENARLYAERSHIAQTLQRSLLPPALPDIEGLELAARYRAAGEQNEVGGDFYDAFRAADGVWTLVIGDVSGKGPEAAALTSLTRHTLRAAALREMNPRENLELLNEALWSQPDADGRFCTVLYARVRPRADGGAEVTLATGGHLPPIRAARRRPRRARPAARLDRRRAATARVRRARHRARARRPARCCSPTA